MIHTTNKIQQELRGNNSEQQYIVSNLIFYTIYTNYAFTDLSVEVSFTDRVPSFSWSQFMKLTRI